MANVFKILRSAIILLIAESTFRVLAQAQDTSIAESFEAIGIVPDVIPWAPAALATIRYPSGVEVNLGNELTPTDVKDKPTVTWEGPEDQLYTLIMTDPDAPSREDPSLREWHHWLVVNIRGNDTNTGEVLTDFVGSAPSDQTGLHRYTILVYQQPGELNCDEPRLSNTTAANREGFSAANFAEKYNLGDPIAGNFFQAQYDDTVPTIHKELGV